MAGAAKEILDVGWQMRRSSEEGGLYCHLYRGFVSDDRQETNVYVDKSIVGELMLK